MNAKLLCSGVFVVGREAEEFIENDLMTFDMGIGDWSDIEVAIDRERRSVTLTKPGFVPRTAVHHPTQGATLLPIGAERVFFTPEEVVANLPDPATTDWPMGERLPREPYPPEVDLVAIEEALGYAFNDGMLAQPQMTRGIVVLYKGRLIAERYAPGFTKDTRQITWSMGKSITAALVGVLAHQGAFKVEDPAPLKAWSDPGDPRGAITIANLLNMSSGLRFHRGSAGDRLQFTDSDHHLFVYFGAANVYDYSIDRDLEFEPGTVNRYRNCDPLSLGQLCREVVEARGESFLAFPQRALFDKIGARNFVLETDAWGNFIMTGYDYGTPRDWARIGQLFLQEGEFNGERIIDKEFVDFVRTPAPADRSRGYGGLFWLNAGGRYRSLPRDMYWPAGHLGNVVTIVPSRQVVIARLGHSGGGGFDGYIERVVGEILAAIEIVEEGGEGR
jgi:CubicO group peptidase (beta-lactamase class C family)